MELASIFNGLVSFSATEHFGPLWCVRTTNPGPDDGGPLGGSSGTCRMWMVPRSDLLTGQTCVDVDPVKSMRILVGCEDGRTGGDILPGLDDL